MNKSLTEEGRKETIQVKEQANVMTETQQGTNGGSKQGISPNQKQAPKLGKLKGNKTMTTFHIDELDHIGEGSACSTPVLKRAPKLGDLRQNSVSKGGKTIWASENVSLDVPSFDFDDMSSIGSGNNGFADLSSTEFDI